MPLPTPPAMRVAYPHDGSQLLHWQPGITSPTMCTNTQMINMNGTNGRAISNPNTTNNENPLYLSIVFPEARNLRGVFVGCENFAILTGDIYTSVDTTNGSDGTWVDSTVNVTAREAASFRETYRSYIQSVSVDGVVGVQIRNITAEYSTGTRYWGAFHVYADVLAATVTDRLQLWHPTLDQPLSVSDFDAGDVPRGDTADITFRLKNVSSTMTAQGSGVTVGVSSDSSPSLLTQVLVSNDGTNFAATASAGDLTAGSLSSVLTVRYTISMSQPLGAWSPYVLPTVTTWV